MGVDVDGGVGVGVGETGVDVGVGETGVDVAGATAVPLKVVVAMENVGREMVEIGRDLVTVGLC